MERPNAVPVGRQYVTYTVASAISLACDMAAFFSCIRLGIGPVPSAFLGYTAGVAVHWLLSSRFVFIDAKQRHGRGKLLRQTLFVATALLGAGLTTGTVGLAVSVGLGPVVSKVIAVAVSFQATYLLRRYVVFSP